MHAQRFSCHADLESLFNGIHSVELLQIALLTNPCPYPALDAQAPPASKVQRRVLQHEHAELCACSVKLDNRGVCNTRERTCMSLADLEWLKAADKTRESVSPRTAKLATASDSAA